MSASHDGLFSGRHNQNQGPPSDHTPRNAGGMTARERRYLRERRRARTHRSLLAESGTGNLRMAVLRPLLSETVTIEVEEIWHVLFPDAQEPDVVGAVDAAADVEAVEDVDVAPDADDAAW